MPTRPPCGAAGIGSCSRDLRLAAAGPSGPCSVAQGRCSRSQQPWLTPSVSTGGRPFARGPRTDVSASSGCRTNGRP
eukprot:5395327-Pyramimonas_sp.AAC.1